MATKTLFVLCVAAITIQIISAQCIGNALKAEELALRGNELKYPAVAAFDGFEGIVPSFSGAFAVTSSSPIPVTGISVVSENAIEGALLVTGELPFLGAVTLEGDLPTGGVGAIKYDCGNGEVGIVSEGLAAPATYGMNMVPNHLGCGPIGYPGYHSKF